MLPPALSEYAVDPVGVLIMRPSAEVEVRMRPDMDIVRWVRWGEAPRWRMTSLRAWRVGGVMTSLSGDVIATRRRLRRRTRAARVGPREAPRFGGQLSFDWRVWLLSREAGDLNSTCAAGESMEWREDGAPDM